MAKKIQDGRRKIWFFAKCVKNIAFKPNICIKTWIHTWVLWSFLCTNHHSIWYRCRDSLFIVSMTTVYTLLQAEQP